MCKNAHRPVQKSLIQIQTSDTPVPVDVQSDDLELELGRELRIRGQLEPVH
jgi:hypothetical protein